MKGSIEVVKGRIEEAAGALTGSDAWRAKGRKHQTVGRVKQAIEEGIRHAGESARIAVDKVLTLAAEPLALGLLPPVRCPVVVSRSISGGCIIRLPSPNLRQGYTP